MEFADSIAALATYQQQSSRYNAPELVSEDEAARLFAERHAGELLFCHDSGRWHRWTGAAWIARRDGYAFHLTREIARELSKNESPKTRMAAGKASFASGIERFSRSDPKFRVTAEVWDSDPWLLGTPGGTVDLRTGILHPADPAARITKLTAVEPADTADCPLWLQFLQEATGTDPELIRLLQQWCGYCLTGMTREQALMFVFGPGGNGKSVFLNVLTSILAEYAQAAAMDTFTASKSDKHSTDLAMLQGARLVTVSETEEGRAWAEARIKQLTGGDPVTARFMRQDNFTFRPQFKLTIVGNHQPMLRNVDEAARRRFNMVPFTRKPAQPDPELEEKLKAEWPAILRWMIEGCLDWQQNGLVRPTSVREATEAYFSEQDLLGQWLADRCHCQPSDQKAWTGTEELFHSWSAYARSAGEDPGTLKSFVPAMRRRGFLPHRTNSGRGFKGLLLRNTPVYGALEK